MRGFNANIYFFLSDAARSMRENPAATALTSLTLGVSMAIFAIFILIFVNLNRAVANWGDRVHMVVYIKDSALAEGAERLKADAMRVPGVKDAVFVSKDAAMSELKKRLKGREGALEGMDSNPLPASFEIRVMDSYLQTTAFASVVERLKKTPWAEDVQYSGEWVKRFSAFLRFIEASAVILGAFLAVATIFVITNTIRLTIYARRDEIEVMRLIGASSSFIMAPFFIEGLAHGVVAGAVSLGMVAAGRFLVATNVPPALGFVVDASLPLPYLALILIAAGTAAGALASAVSLARFLR